MAQTRSPTRRQHPARVGLYLGDLTFLSGLWEHWAHVLRSINARWMPLWDKSFLSADVLRGLSTVIVPGGFCWNPKGAFGGATGCRNLRRAVANGLNYVGTCYGALVAMSEGKGSGYRHIGLVRGSVLPNRTCPCRGIARIDYDGGPQGNRSKGQLTPHVNGDTFGEGDYEVFGRFSADQPGPFETPPPTSIAGLPAAISARHGKGKVILFASHPEMPVSYSYSDVFNRIEEGDWSLDKAIRRCWHPPAVSAKNMRLLRSLFRQTHSTGRGKATMPLASPECVGLLASAKELQKLQLMEIEESILRHLSHAGTPTLQFAARVLERRLRQARHFLNTLSPDDLWQDPRGHEASALVLILRQFAVTGDHPGYMKKARLDYQIAQVRRLRSKKGKARQRIETSLALSIVDKLDSLVYTAQ